MRSALVVVGLVGSLLGCVGGHYREAREARVEKTCKQPRYQYEAGYNRGLAQAPLDPSWADQQCQPDVRDWARYVSGYQAGISLAQQAVNYTVGYAELIHGSKSAHYAPAYSFARSCKSSSDCDGMSCRPREDGARVCMGYGSPGEACWFGADCLSGSCELQGTIKVCR
jgi:hypothetical protein